MTVSPFGPKPIPVTGLLPVFPAFSNSSFAFGEIKT
jgi:hypothetical protein